MLYYSRTTNSIYDNQIVDVIPEDSVELSMEDYLELRKQLALGAVLVSDKYGKPTTENINELNTPQISKREDEICWRNFQLSIADVELCKVQDADPKAYGSVSEWRAYRKQLRAWTEHENFPDVSFRPNPPIKIEG